MKPLSRPITSTNITAATAFAVLVLVCCAGTARAQRADEYVPFPTAVVARESVLRGGHSPREARLRTLAPDTRLELLTGRVRRGYRFVSTPDGTQGWVRARNLRAEPPALLREDALAPMRAGARREGPCATSFDACKPSGCADADSDRAAERAEALVNTRKRDFASVAGAQERDAVLVTVADMANLQGEAQTKVGRASGAFSLEERGRLVDLHAARGTLREGSLVKFAGFVALSARRPEVAGDESVNCGFTARAQKDFHIPVAARRGDTEFRGFVVEMIPQSRPAGWTVPKLKAIQRDRRRILVVGALFYDSAHRVNKDAANPISNQPPRVSVWEIHPVSRFFVCNKTRGACDPEDPAQWTPLERFTP
ncbi:MAG: hypothetical protein ABR554_15275 [Pyrinomonadaceae bacterium]